MRRVITLMVFVVAVCFIVATMVSAQVSLRVRLRTMGTFSIGKALVQEFMKTHPEIDITLEMIGGLKEEIKFMTDTAAKTAPDIVAFRDEPFLQYAKYGPFLALNDFLEKDPDFDKDKFFSTSLPVWVYQEKQYGFPWYGGVDGPIYYNMDMFDKAGLKYPSKNWTYDDFLSLAEKLTEDTNGDGKIDQWGASFDMRWFPQLIVLWSFGGDLFNEDRTRCVLDSKESMAAHQWVHDLIWKYHAHPRPDEDEGVLFIMYNNCAMARSGPWMLPAFFENIKDFRWDIAYPPVGPVRRGSYPTWDGLAISSQTKHPAEAYEVLKFMTFREASQERMARAGLLPILIYPARLIANPDTPQHEEVFVETVRDAEVYLRMTPNWDLINDKIIMPKWEKFIDLNKITVEEFCKSAAKEINETLFK